MAKRIVPENCLGAIIDVQEFFLSQVGRRNCSKIKVNIKNFIRLLSYFKIPIVLTLERPVEQKGIVPAEIGDHTGDLIETFEKSFFDLTKEKKSGTASAAGEEGKSSWPVAKPMSVYFSPASDCLVSVMRSTLCRNWCFPRRAMSTRRLPECKPKEPL